MKRSTQTGLLIVGLFCWLPVMSLAEPSGETASDEPSRIEKDLFDAPRALSAADGIIDSGPSWGHSSPWVADVDGDGASDLVVGDFSGLFRFYRNSGTDALPRYAQGVNLQAGGVDAKVPIY